MGMTSVPVTSDIERKVIESRLNGTARNEIAAQFGLSLWKVKQILKLNGIALSDDVKQRNAYQAKLKKNPNCLADMRKSLTPAVIAVRSASIREAYKNPDLIALKTEQNRAIVYDDYKYTWGDFVEACRGTKLTVVDIRSLHKRFENEPVTLECECGNRITPSIPYDILYGKYKSCGCVKSSDELDLFNWIDGLVPCEKHDRKLIAPFELDITIPSLKVAVEYCGLHFHGERLKKDKARRCHLDKLARCEAIGWRLVTVFADEWLSSRRKTENAILSILGKKTDKVGARECALGRIAPKEARKFLNDHHLLGHSGTIFYGLKNDGALVSVASFKFQNGGWVWTRFCCGERAVPGAASRLLSAFRKDFSPGTITTFSDRRWSVGHLYTSLGFTKDETLPPSYWYFEKCSDRERFHKSSFRKEKLAQRFSLDPGQTEWEMAQAAGYDRIWDCGLDRWVLNLAEGGHS